MLSVYMINVLAVRLSCHYQIAATISTSFRNVMSLRTSDRGPGVRPLDYGPVVTIKCTSTIGTTTVGVIVKSIITGPDQIRELGFVFVGFFGNFPKIESIS